MGNPLSESNARSIAFKSHRDVPESAEGSLPILTQFEKVLTDIPQYEAAWSRDTSRWPILPRTEPIGIIQS